MKTTSAFPSEGSKALEPASAAPCPAEILVWDLPVRVFHWLLVLCFVGLTLSGDSERWRLPHVVLGTTVGGLVVFRLLWGLVGTRHARFADFVRGPRAVARYVGSMLDGRPEHHAGHNPAGAVAIVALLVLAAVAALTGWASYQELGGEWLEEVHEGAANLMLAVVGVHLAGVLVGSWLHRENLVRAMFTGRKHAAPGEGIARAWATIAALLLLAVLAFWWWQWQAAPGA